MATNKTTPQPRKSVQKFISQIDGEELQRDSRTVHQIMLEISGEKAVLWGTSIVGYGTYHYVYASKHEGEWMRIGWAPRKNGIALYLMCGFAEGGSRKLLNALGKHKAGKGCLNIRRLADVDLKVLKKLIAFSWKEMQTKYPAQMESPRKKTGKAKKSASKACEESTKNARKKTTGGKEVAKTSTKKSASTTTASKRKAASNKRIEHSPKSTKNSAPKKRIMKKKNFLDEGQLQISAASIVAKGQERKRKETTSGRPSRKRTRM